MRKANRDDRVPKTACAVVFLVAFIGGCANRPDGLLADLASANFSGAFLVPDNQDFRERIDESRNDRELCRIARRIGWAACLAFGPREAACVEVASDRGVAYIIWVARTANGDVLVIKADDFCEHITCTRRNSRAAQQVLEEALALAGWHPRGWDFALVRGFSVPAVFVTVYSGGRISRYALDWIILDAAPQEAQRVAVDRNSAMLRRAARVYAAAEAVDLEK